MTAACLLHHCADCAASVPRPGCSRLALVRPGLQEALNSAGPRRRQAQLLHRSPITGARVPDRSIQVSRGRLQALSVHGQWGLALPMHGKLDPIAGDAPINCAKRLDRRATPGQQRLRGGSAGLLRPGACCDGAPHDRAAAGSGVRLAPSRGCRRRERRGACPCRLCPCSFVGDVATALL